MSEIAIVGTGYVGLTAGACFAHLGHRVVCYDIDEAKIDKLSKGEIPIVEEGLEILVKEGLEEKRLSFVIDPQKAISESEVVFLCVQTPQQADGTTDISMVDLAVSQIVKFLPPNSVLVNKSTVPVGSAQKVFEKLQRPDVEVVSNPEFLREGSAVDDFLNPERIIFSLSNLYLFLISSINLYKTFSALIESSKIYSGSSLVKSNHWKPFGFIGQGSWPFGQIKIVLGKCLFQFKDNMLISLPSPPYP